MAGPHSGWPYPTGDPLSTEEERKSQAGLMFADVCAGKSITKIAKDYGVDRSTVYARLLLISPQVPARASLRAINFIRTERMIESLADDFESDEIELADKVRLSSEVRQLLDRQAAWFRLADEDPADPEQAASDVPDEDWEANEL